MGILSVTVGAKSAWEFSTFGSGGFSLGVFAAEGGLVVLKSPSSGQDETFYYGGIGAGLSEGFKIPKIGKVQINTGKGPLTGSGGPTAFPSTGVLFLTDVLGGAELTTSDIQGPCAFTEVAGGIIGGASACAMYIGLDPARYAALGPSMLVPGGQGLGIQFVLGSAKGVLLMAGLNVGLQAQIGIAGYFGYLH